MHPIGLLLQAAGNRLLHFDPDTRQRFAALTGRTICLRVMRAPLAPIDIVLEASEAGLRRIDPPPATVDVTISATSIVFARLALGRPMASGDIQLSGDVGLGQAFQRALEHVHVDWEEMLTHVMGDVVAHQVFRAARGTAQRAKAAVDVLQRDTAEYLVEESRVIASRQAIEQFLDGVDRLRADTDRLAARLDRLDKTRSS